ncbi:MAG: ATP-binding protein [Burkholderiales bacterium]
MTMRVAMPRVLSLRAVLALLPLAAALPMVLFAVFLLNRAWEEGRAHGEQDLARWLHTQTQILEREMDAYQRELRTLGDSLLIGQLSAEAFRADAARVMNYNRAWANITLVDSKGRPRVQSRGAVSDPSPAEYPHVLTALTTGGAVHSDLLHNPLTDQFNVAIALPILDERSAVGVVHGELNSAALAAMLSALTEGTRFVTILDRQYRVIARSREAELYLGKSIGQSRIALIQAHPQAGSALSDNMSGQPHRVIWQQASNGWTVVVGEDVSVYVDPLRQSLITLLIVGLLLLLLGIGSSRLTSRYFERQFASLRHDASRLAAGSLIESRDSRIFEIQELGQALREAAARLSMAQSGRERAIGALQEADHRKDEFLSILAHELRNPMAPLRNAITLLQGRTQDDPTSQRMLTLADRQLGHLSRLVDDLLDVARISRGRLELRRERLVLQEVLREAAETLQPMLAERFQTLDMRLPDTEVWLDADRVRLTQVFENLLSNASKYSKAGDSIDIDLNVNEAHVEILISDPGVGLRPDELEQIFEIYRQIEQSAHHSQGGLGIGLALVRRLVMLHGGTVSAHSDGPEQGSCFKVLLPRRASR